MVHLVVKLPKLLSSLLMSHRSISIFHSRHSSFDMHSGLLESGFFVRIFPSNSLSLKERILSDGILRQTLRVSACFSPILVLLRAAPRVGSNFLFVDSD